MSADAYHPPTTSPRLETLDVLSIGMSLDVFRQGQVWKALQEQNAAQAEALHVGSILPMDRRSIRRLRMTRIWRMKSAKRTPWN